MIIHLQTGLLARLAVYQGDRKLLACGDVGLSTQAWKDNIMADIQFTQGSCPLSHGLLSIGPSQIICIPGIPRIRTRREQHRCKHIDHCYLAR